MAEQFNFTPGTVCDSDAKAMNIVAQIKGIRDNAEYMVAWYKEQIKKTQEAAEFDVMGLEASLREYFDTVPHKKAKQSESYTFPGGKLTLKKQQPEYKRDDSITVPWLKENGFGQFVRVKEETAWDDLKAASAGIIDGHVVFESVNEDGEIVQTAVPGIDVVERAEKFVVEVK